MGFQEKKATKKLFKGSFGSREAKDALPMIPGDEPFEMAEKLQESWERRTPEARSVYLTKMKDVNL